MFKCTFSLFVLFGCMQWGLALPSPNLSQSSDEKIFDEFSHAELTKSFATNFASSRKWTGNSDLSSQKPAVYRAWGPWPYNNDDAAPEYRGKIPIHVQRMEETDQQRDVLSLLSSNMFQTNADDGYLKLESESEEQSKPFEEIKLDMDGNRYEKIELPSKTASRFVHDFQSNYTSIVDVANERCFIMPLDRSSILPPKSMFDLLFKMSNGYYSMDTEKIRHDMRVVMPALNDINAFGVYIKQECDGFASYKLEKFVGGVSAN